MCGVYTAPRNKNLGRGRELAESGYAAAISLRIDEIGAAFYVPRRSEAAQLAACETREGVIVSRVERVNERFSHSSPANNDIGCSINSTDGAMVPQPQELETAQQ